MDTERPETLALATELRAGKWTPNILQNESALRDRAADEMECLHAENESLRSSLDRLKSAFDEWHEKTEWVQKSARPKELGKHRADVLRERIEELESPNRHTLQAAGSHPAPCARHCEAVAFRSELRRLERLAEDRLRDAARYRFLRDGEWHNTELEPFIRLQLNTLWDAKIDAAIAARAAQGSAE